MFRVIRKKKKRDHHRGSKAAALEDRRDALTVNGAKPPAIPINYYFDKETRKIYFYGAKSGHKIQALRVCNNKTR